MMKRTLFLVVIVICMDLFALAQAYTTKIIINQSHKNMPAPGMFELQIRGFDLKINLDSTENVQFNIPELLSGPWQLILFYRRNNSSLIWDAWSEYIDFN